MITIKTILKLLSGPPIKLLVNDAEVVKFKDGSIFIGNTLGPLRLGQGIGHEDPLPYLYEIYKFKEIQIKVLL